MIERIPFAINIFILVPVVYSMFLNGSGMPVFEGKIPDSLGLRFLIASLWAAILFCSILALIWPAAVSSILVLQFIYKLIWLLVFILPLWWSGNAVPWGITNSFLFIVLVWPYFIWQAFSGLVETMQQFFVKGFFSPQHNTKVPRIL